MRRKSTSAVRRRDAATREPLETARRTVARHETLVLTEADRKVFFHSLMTPPRANERLERAFGVARRRVRA